MSRSHRLLIVTDCSTHPRGVALLDEVIDQLDTGFDGCPPPDCRALAGHALVLVVANCSTRPRGVALLDEVIDQLDTRFA